MAPKRKRSVSTATTPKSKVSKPTKTHRRTTDSSPDTPPSPSSKPRRRGPPTHPDANTRYHLNAAIPLFRLPRELRDQIWSLLYGFHILHPKPNYISTSATRKIHPLRFPICQSPYTPRDIYAFSLRGAAPDNQCRWAAPELNDYKFCARQNQSNQARPKPRAEKPEPLQVPIVCRQMWDEMSSVVYQTCTFAFTQEDNFLYFLGCKKAGLACVRRVLLSPGAWAKPYERAFRPGSLKWFSLKRLGAVRSLDLWVTWKGGEGGEKIGTLGGGEWMKYRELEGQLKSLQGMVRELRRWELKAEWTRVVVEGKDVDKWGYNKSESHVPIAERVELARQIRESLLERAKKTSEVGSCARRSHVTEAEGTGKPRHMCCDYVPVYDR